jgi:hypothetical protein
LLAAIVSALLGASRVEAQLTSRQTERAVVPADGVGTRFGLPYLHSSCRAGYNPNYHQCLFVVPSSATFPVRSVALRGGSPIPFPAFSVEIEIGVGHSPSRPSFFSFDLPANRGPDFEIVLSRRTIHFTAMTSHGGEPPKYPFRFDRPFLFRPGQTGVVELRVFGSTLCIGDPRFQNVTFEFYDTPRGSTWSMFGTSCSHLGSSGNVLLAGPMSAGNPGSASMGPTFDPVPAMLFGGFSKTHWAGLTLPFALDAWGAPGCSIHASLEWQFPRYWWGPNTVFKLFALDLPNVANLVGRTIYLQGVIPVTRNRLGFETSNGSQVVVGPHIDPPLSYVTTPLAHGGTEGGQRLVGHGPVLELWDR